MSKIAPEGVRGRWTRRYTSEEFSRGGEKSLVRHYPYFWNCGLPEPAPIVNALAPETALACPARRESRAGYFWLLPRVAPLRVATAGLNDGTP
jgi:hypothetical protein